jgi:transposase
MTVSLRHQAIERIWRKKYTSIHKANSDDHTTKLILYRLVQSLDKEGAEWRQTSILLLDGASYHKSSSTLMSLQRLRIPTMFTSPHSPMICPVELLFAQVKKGDLNPNDEQQTKK